MTSTEPQAVTNFRDYLRIKTVQPNPDYDGATKFLRKLGEDLGLQITVIQITEEHPMLLMTWDGSQPSLPSVVFSSHMDVVPVFAEHWKVDPFSAEKFSNGDIYARGTQDMKSVGIQYLEAIRKLKARGHRPLRTVHVLYTTDEEIGSINGMKQFVHRDEFKNMNVGCVIDEGLASPSDEFVVYNGEKVNYCVTIKCPGNPGHGSQLIVDTAGEKIRDIIDKMMDLRSSEKKKLETGEATMSDIIVCNLTMLKGGVQINVVPAEITASFDIRVPPTTPKEKITTFLNDVCSADGVTWAYLMDPKPTGLASVEKGYPWWRAFSTTFENQKVDHRVALFPASTDSRYVRQLNIPAYGFSPMNNTPILLHDHNEFLNEAVFLRGIDIYVELISQMSHVPEFITGI